MPAWALTYPNREVQFKQACSRFGIPAVPSRKRRSGSSIDRALQFRSLGGVRRKRRRVRRKSIVHYEKTAGLSKAWHYRPADSQKHFKALDARLEGLLPQGAGRAASGTERR